MSLTGHTDAVYSAMFDASGTRIITASGDRSVRVWDVARLSQAWPQLATDACNTLLGALGRRFSKAEVEADQLLGSEWPDAARDVCEGEKGAASIETLRRRAGLLAEDVLKQPASEGLSRP